MPQIINYIDETEWLKLREIDVTSSDVAVLFDHSPYCTLFEYWHRKKNNLTIAFEETERTKWGKRYEAPTAEGLAEDYGWKIKPLKCYMRHDAVQGMGSSFDYEIEENGEIGILEIKCVDYKEYKAKWLVDDEVEAPLHIELQLQHQLEVADRNFGYIAAMIGGNKPVVVRRERDREIGRHICRRINEFWKSIRDNIEPLPDFKRDGDVIKMLYGDADGQEVDLSNNNRIASLIAEYPALQVAASEAKKAQEAAKAEIAAAMKTASLGRVGDALITRKIVKRAGYTVQPCEYVDLRIKQPKGEKQ